MANTNAEQGLNLKVASNATVRRQFATLAEALELEEVPERLECFDVSHTSGEATVASCVVFNQAGPLKSDYRRFNLSPESAGDDYAAMAEVLRRRRGAHLAAADELPNVIARVLLVRELSAVASPMNGCAMVGHPCSFGREA